MSVHVLAAAAAASASDPWWVAPAVVAALIAGSFGVVTLAVNGRRARLDRQRELFALAFGDIAAYCEFPYIVRRRRADPTGEERTRITSELSEVQRRLNHNQAVLRVEAPRVGRAYAALVQAMRRCAGAAIHAGWDQPVRDVDDLHVTDVDLTPIDADKDAFLTTAADHLALAPWWSRAAGRWIGSQAVRALRWARAAVRRAADRRGATNTATPDPETSP